MVLRGATFYVDPDMMRGMIDTLAEKLRRFRMLIGRELAVSRRARNLTLAELGRRSGVNREVLGRIERGKTMPTASTLAKIDAVLLLTTASDEVAPQLALWVYQTLKEYFQHDFGTEHPEREAVEFMRAHAGCTIVVPVMPIIEAIARGK
jgi:transcriptional regulator with XRE-family HTH domain